MEPAKAEQAAKSLSHEATGPRTLEGKQRSKYNAVKHGGLCKRLLIKGESQADNDGLWEDLKPQGTLSLEIFTDIFMIRLAQRRFYKARNAAIAERVQFSEIDRSETLQDWAWYLERWAHGEDGMLKPGGNPLVIRKCIEILQEVYDSVEKHGFEDEHNRHLLRKLYGTDMDGAAVGVYDHYVRFARVAQETAGGDQEHDPDIYRRIMLMGIYIEIVKLKKLEKTELRDERLRRKYGVDKSLVLPQKALDLDMRYEAHLSRELARKLILFENAQQMFKGLPILSQGKADE
jgi:hypothetical protein